MPLFLFFFLLISTLFLLAATAQAQCPVCIVTVGGGMLLAKKFGVDDLLVSIWISGLNTAIAFWLSSKMKSTILKNGHFLSLAFLVTTLAYFQFTGQLGSPLNRFFGIDKIIFGQIIGVITMLVANHGYSYVKTRLGRAPFPYAKVAFPLSSLVFITLILKFVFKL
ncbi:MAG: hypothetical protein WC686_03420 [Candidatus Shapirobacteria bacterium]|jgi:hypothetical protein